MIPNKLTVTLLETGYTFQADGVTVPINSKTVVRYFFGYREAELIVPFDDPFLTPFRLIVLIRLLSRGRSVIRCVNGIEMSVTLLTFFYLLAHPSYFFAQVKREWRSIHDRLLGPRLLREVSLEIGELLVRADESRKYEPVYFSKPVVYLRAILAYGVKAGGSVGHIAGILNSLEYFTAPPVFITTDRMPTVQDTIRTHIVRPSDSFSSVTELRDVYFSRTFEREVLSILDGVEPAFIYQRESLFNYSGVNVSRRLNVPLVMEFNGSEIWVSRHWGIPLKHESLARQIELCSLKSADVIIVVSAPLRDSLLEMGIDPGRILVNPNGVDPDAYSPEVDGSAIRSKYRLADTTVIGFIGTFGHWHGAEILAEAFGMLLRERPEYRERVRLFMVGDGLKMPVVKACLASYGAADYTVLTGLVPQPEGPGHLAACDILVSPHRPNPDGTPFFGSPTKLFEYMAMGKGIVASDLDQIGEILGHGKTAWMMKAGDPLSLKEGLEKLIDDQVLRNNLGAAARAEVVKNFTWKEHTRKIIEKVKDVLG